MDDPVGEPDDDTTYLHMSNGNGSQEFSFSAFTLPPDATISRVSVYSRVKRVSVGDSVLFRTYLQVGGSVYVASNAQPDTSYENRVDNWTVNPHTSSAWTVDDVNGSGANPLEFFALSTVNVGAGESIRCTQCYIEVEYEGSNAIALTSPEENHGYTCDDDDEATVTVAGTYSGEPTTIEARHNVTGAESWVVLDAAPVGGNFSGSLVCTVGDGAIEVRFSNDTEVTASVDNIRVGDGFCWFGQSNAVGIFTNGQDYTSAIGSSVYDESGAWGDLVSDYKDPNASTFSVLPLLASLITSNTGRPAIFICRTTSGSGLVSTGQWADGGTDFEAAMTNVENSGVSRIRLILYYQGEDDANHGVTESQFSAALAEMLADMRADQSALATSKLVAAIIGEIGDATSDEISEIQQAVISAATNNPNDIVVGISAHDQDFADGVHWSTDAQAIILAAREWRVIKYYLYSGAEDARGPRFSSGRFAGNQVVVTLTGGVSPIVNGTNVTGWVVVDGAGARTVTAASSSGLVVTLTCDQSLVAPVTVSYGDGERAVGTTTRDSGTVAAVPIEPFVDKAVNSGMGRIVNGGLVNAGLVNRGLVG